jgi:transcriptional regulator with XRE-family HTH domain
MPVKPLYSAASVLLRELLVEARSRADLTQEDVAERLCRPQSFVSKYESGERRLDVVEFLEVCAAVGVDGVKVLRQVEAARTK